MSYGTLDDPILRRIDPCPVCGNRSTHVAVVYADGSESGGEIEFQGPDGEVDIQEVDVDLTFFLAVCESCKHPLLYVEYMAWESDQPFRDARLIWPQNNDSEDAHLGAAAMLLTQRGEEKAAALLLDASKLTYIETGRATNAGGHVLPSVDAVIEVAPHLVDRFDEMTLEVVGQVVSEVAFRGESQKIVRRVRVAPALPGGDWRKDVQEALGGGEVHPAFSGLPTERARVVDKFPFLSEGEVRMYEALKARLATGDRFGFVPQAPILVSDGKTFWVDFLVLRGKKAAAIEVDGPSHNKRYANDQSRDRLLQKAGLTRIEHIPVEDTNSAAELEKFLDDFFAFLDED